MWDDNQPKHPPNCDTARSPSSKFLLLWTSSSQRLAGGKVPINVWTKPETNHDASRRARVSLGGSNAEHIMAAKENRALRSAEGWGGTQRAVHRPSNHTEHWPLKWHSAQWQTFQSKFWKSTSLKGDGPTYFQSSENPLHNGGVLTEVSLIWRTTGFSLIV